MRFGALLLLTCVLATWSTPAEACKCVSVPTDLMTNLRDSRDGADAIFHARVVSVDPIGLGVFGRHQPEATLEVLETFKGRVSSKFALPSGSGSCAFTFETGGEYLVYASRNGGEWVVIVCSWTRPVTPDDVELEWLKTGRPPLVPVALQRVSLRWCERLEVSPDASRPEFRCVNPGPAQEVCDETKSRTARWEPKERIEAARCYWGRPDQPRCELQKEAQPLAAEAPAWPLLACKPGYNRDSSADYSCRVLPANTTP